MLKIDSIRLVAARLGRHFVTPRAREPELLESRLAPVGSLLVVEANRDSGELQRRRQKEQRRRRKRRLMKSVAGLARGKHAAQRKHNGRAQTRLAGRACYLDCICFGLQFWRPSDQSTSVLVAPRCLPRLSRFVSLFIRTRAEQSEFYRRAIVFINYFIANRRRSRRMSRPNAPHCT